MTEEQYAEIDARLIALETLIALTAPYGALDRATLIALLQDMRRAMKTRNVHAAAIETLARVEALVDGNQQLPPGSLGD